MSDDDKRRSKASEEAEEIREIFDALNDAIPKLISGLIGSVYSPEAAEAIATAIGNFYTKLIEKGIPEALALELTKKYVGGLDFAQFMDMASSSGRRIDVRVSDDDDDDFDED